MRVLVTGGTGFLGQWITQQLAGTGHEAFATSSRAYDLRHRLWIDAALRDHQPDAIIHAAAAVGGIGANLAEPGRFYHDNALMGVQLLERARLFGVKKIVVIGTACEYPAQCPQPMGEEMVWDGYPTPATASYALAKRGLLAMGQAYREQYGLNVIHVIPSNLYGPGDHFDGEGTHVVPATIRRFSEAAGNTEPIVMWGSGAPTRDFLYVADAARGIARALERYSHPLPLNLGSGEETPIRRLAWKVANYYGIPWTRIEWDTSRPDGASRRLLDITRAEATINWRPRVSLNDGLAHTIETYEAAR